MRRFELEETERKRLKPYACFSDTAVRTTEVIKHPIRTEFQRDRDRIIHSKAFRRLEYKTQVFLSQKGDHLRTRLTHSLEVSQLSRTMAVQLGLNSDLVEAISLGHDVGHTPFGHIGEKTIDELLRENSNLMFKHNVQSVRILEFLEKKYHYDGLHLTIPVLEGILKHTSFPHNLPDYCEGLYLDKSFSVTLEGQVVAIADELAQITHDMDDYLRYGIIDLNNFLKHPLYDNVKKFYEIKYKFDLDKHLLSLDLDKQKDCTIRSLVDYLICTLIEQAECSIESDVKAYEINRVYIDYEEETKSIIKSFQKHLSDMLKVDYRISEMDRRGKDIVSTLFKYYMEKPSSLPDITYELYKQNGIIVISDYISGMTDRYALEKYNELIDLY